MKKLLAEQVVHVSMLKEMLGKTFEARLTQKRRDLSYEREAIQSKARLCLGWDCSTGLPTRVEAISG